MSNTKNSTQTFSFNKELGQEQHEGYVNTTFGTAREIFSYVIFGTCSRAHRIFSHPIQAPLQNIPIGNPWGNVSCSQYLVRITTTYWLSYFLKWVDAVAEEVVGMRGEQK